MYRLPSQPGNYTAQLVDSFYTGKWITSAALNPSATAFVLLSNAQIWLYTNFTGSAFSQANAVKLEMDSTQKEGITFINDTAVYISDERFWGIGGNLYYLSLGNWIPKTPEPSEFSVQVINNPSSTELNLTINGSASYKVEVFNCLGKLVDVKLLSGGYQLYKLHRNDVGILYARITAENGQVKVCSAMLY